VCPKTSPAPLRRAVVIAQEAAEPFAAANVRAGPMITLWRDQLVVESLMVPLKVRSLLERRRGSLQPVQ
jgi:hypothetical protein